jgi:hypothetical protein
MEMRAQGGLPDMYVLVLPDGAADLYQQIKQYVFFYTVFPQAETFQFLGLSSRRRHSVPSKQQVLPCEAPILC